jgi:two-component system LytT family response regulator
MSSLELRAVIVDDEAPARELLQELLEAHSEVKIVGEANSVGNAALLCASLRPNLIFLDVQMPGGDGFSLLSKLDPLPAVIFVTAYEQYAVRAFEINAVDYLLKPIRADRLSHALQRIILQPRPTHMPQLQEEDRIFLRSDTQLRVVFVTEIAAIEAEENYSRVCLVDGSAVLIRRGMNEWETMLPKEIFLRTHRSLIVNLKAIRKVRMEGRDEVALELSGCAAPRQLGRMAALRLRRALKERNT